MDRDFLFHCLHVISTDITASVAHDNGILGTQMDVRYTLPASQHMLIVSGQGSTMLKETRSGQTVEQQQNG